MCGVYRSPASIHLGDERVRRSDHVVVEASVRMPAVSHFEVIDGDVRNETMRWSAL